MLILDVAGGAAMFSVLLGYWTKSGDTDYKGYFSITNTAGNTWEIEALTQSIYIVRLH